MYAVYADILASRSVQVRAYSLTTHLQVLLSRRSSPLPLLLRSHSMPARSPGFPSIVPRSRPRPPPRAVIVMLRLPFRLVNIHAYRGISAPQCNFGFQPFPITTASDAASNAMKSCEDSCSFMQPVRGKSGPKSMHGAQSMSTRPCMRV